MALLTSKKSLDADAPKTFQYLAVSATGVRVKSKMIAPARAAVLSALQAEGYIPLKVEEISTTGLNFDVSGALSNRPLRLSHSGLADFSRRFHQLLKAGLSVPKAVAALGEEQAPKMAAMTSDISEKTAGGLPLSEAFSGYPSCFDDVFVSYISAGEQTGELVDTTSRLARMLEKRAQLSLKIKSVTAYPKMVSYAIGLIVVMIILFMVPMYAEIYEEFGAELPAPTRMLVALSESIFPIGWNGFSETLPGWVGYPYPKPTSPTLYLIAAIFGVKYWLRSTKDDLDLGTKLDKLRFRLPIFGKLSYRLMLFRWSSTLAGALSSGMQMAPALDLAAQASGSRWQMKVAEELKDGVRAGKPLSEVMTLHRELYPPNVRAMIRTGEGTGELPNMLQSVSEAVDDEIDALVAGLGAKIEVALLIVMGVVVGALLVVLYLPILNLATTAGEGLSGGEF